MRKTGRVLRWRILSVHGTAEDNEFGRALGIKNEETELEGKVKEFKAAQTRG